MPPNAFDYFAIQNTIARYCIALDTKNFDLLHDVFAPTVTAKYPVFEATSDVATLAQAIQKRLSPVTSQHALTTQTIAISDDGKTAEASTYFTGIHFGQGKWEGQQRTAWGRYVDSLSLVESKGALPGASGHWVIHKREVVFMGESGDDGMMGE